MRIDKNTNGFLYMLTFSNGKIYIGITRKSVISRYAEHRKLSNSVSPKLKVHRAWSALGAPKCVTLANVCGADLEATEVRAIAIFDSVKRGYNLSYGGDISPMLNPEIAAKVSELAKAPERIAKTIAVHKGSRRSDECKAAMSAMRKGVGKGVPKSAEHRSNIAAALRVAIRTYVTTPEHAAKISAANKGRKLTAAHKAKIAAAKTGVPLTPEHRANVSKGRLAARGKNAG